MKTDHVKKIKELNAKIVKLEAENKELRVIAERTKESEMNLANKLESTQNKLKSADAKITVFANKYLALNNSIKHLCQANDNTIV